MILDLVARFANWRAEYCHDVAKHVRARRDWWESIAMWCEAGGRMRMLDIRQAQGRRA